MLTRRLLVIVAGIAVSAAAVALFSGKRVDPVGRDRKPDILAGLARLGPLPDDATITQAQLDEFSDIIGWVELAPPDPDYIRPLLRTFGYGYGVDLYVHGANALLKQDRAATVAAALDVLESGRDGPRQWAMETLRRLREGDRGNPPPLPREVQAVEVALRGPELVAHSAVYWAYWVEDSHPAGRRLLELAARVSPGEARVRAAELLAE